MTSLKGAIPRYSCNPSCETLGVIDAFLEGHGCCHGGQWDPKKIMRPDILKVHTRQSSSSKMINSSRRLCSLLQNPWRKQCGDHEFQAISSSISGVVFEEHMMRIGYDVINICKIVCVRWFLLVCWLLVSTIQNYQKLHTSNCPSATGNGMCHWVWPTWQHSLGWWKRCLEAEAGWQMAASGFTRSWRKKLLI